MDLQDLNKSQLILLAILLSFVTSIATGITTVTLMQQAPASFTVPVNRVIRQTIEKIEQVEGKTTIETVVIKEEDLVVDAISKNTMAVFALSKDGYDLEGKSIEIPAGRAFAVSVEGIVVADTSLASGSDAYYLKNESGKFKAKIFHNDPSRFSFIKIGEAINNEESKPDYVVPIFGDLSKMKIGQKIIILGSTISSQIFEGGSPVNLPVTKTNGGGLVLNLDGEAIGMAISGENGSIIPISVINEALKGVSVEN